MESDPPILSRRAYLKRLAKWTVAPIAGVAYATQVEPFWFDVCEVPVPVANLPPALDGFRISHLTDLHASDSVPLRHLEKACEIAASQKPDIVVVTGDLVTHTYDYIEPVARMLKSMNLPVFVSYGNHDYVPWGAVPGPYTMLGDTMQRELERAGCAVLRNRSVSLEKNGVRFWLTGLEDAYTDYFNPPAAFANRPAGETTICLSHNPDTVEDLLPFKPDVILSGHTHGGQIRVPFLGAPLLPIFHRKRNKGLWKLPYGHLYVSRGVGFLLHARFWCRPEIPLIILKREA